MRRNFASQCTRASRKASLSPPTTLLPFLYQTRSIQTFAKAHKKAQRNQSRPTNERSTTSHGADIPFENVAESQPGEKNEATAAEDGSTLSATEQAAFAQLFDKLASGRTNRPSAHPVALRSKPSKQPQSRGSKVRSREAALARLPPSLRSIAEAAGVNIGVEQAGQEQEITSGAQHGQKPPSDEEELDEAFEQEVLGHFDSIRKLIEEQRTDMDVWNVLQNEVFKPLEALDLDGNQDRKQQKDAQDSSPQAGTTKVKSNADSTTKAGKKKAASQPEPLSTTNPEVLVYSLPQIMVFTLEHIHTKYPASPLCLSLLPHLRRLSRTAHLLSLTPALYAAVLRITWTRTNSPHRIVAILQEMETEGVELERAVLASLTKILEEADAMKAGKWGKAVQMVSGFEGWADQVEALKDGWVPLVHQRIVNAAVREVREREARAEAGGSSAEAEGEDAAVVEETSAEEESEIRLAEEHAIVANAGV